MYCRLFCRCNLEAQIKRLSTVFVQKWLSVWQLQGFVWIEFGLFVFIWFYWVSYCLFLDCNCNRIMCDSINLMFQYYMCHMFNTITNWTSKMSRKCMSTWNKQNKQQIYWKKTFNNFKVSLIAWNDDVQKVSVHWGDQHVLWFVDSLLERERL